MKDERELPGVVALGGLERIIEFLSGRKVLEFVDLQSCSSFQDRIRVGIKDNGEGGV